MTNRKRDYRAEYQRRVQSGKAKGLSKSQSRGHPKVTEKLIAEKRKKPLTARQKKKFFDALHDNKSFKDAARMAGISQEKLRHLVASSPYIVKKRGVLAFSDNMPTTVLIYSRNKEEKITVTYKISKEVGTYIYAVGQFFETRNKSYLAPYIGKSVTDIKTKKKYPYETNPNNLLMLDHSSVNSFDGVYDPQP